VGRDDEAPSRSAIVRQLRQPRLAEIVASALRNDILNGRLTEGDALPRQEDLLADFKVSPPAVREALRILETEGLVSVRRGNVGGALVHVPSARGVAYMVSLVLQAQQTTVDDVGNALSELEPVCASICASRPDRADTVVPKLRELILAQEQALGEVPLVSTIARQFHETLVAECGNETMILVIGALESVWTSHQAQVFEIDAAVTSAGFTSALQAHKKLTDAIEEGDADLAMQVARRHLEATHAFTISARPAGGILADALRAEPVRPA
jgi:DNA-binding FadR family transcriptional regulator